MTRESPVPSAQLRRLPGVGALLEQAPDLVAVEGRARVADALRRVLDEARAAIRAGGSAPLAAELVALARQQLQAGGAAPLSGAVINATGVILHTNLGRALLSRAAQLAMQAVAADYSALEYDLDTGQRGARGRAVEQLLCDVTGAQAALVVNNCAAATVLMLSAIARGRAVVISRGQLVEIGGGFRIPDILRQSGAELIEVGTTNRTRLSDYEQVIVSRQSAVSSRQSAAGSRQPEVDCRLSTADFRLMEVGAILRVHASNFRMVGFTEEVPVGELVALSRAIAQSPTSNLHSPLSNPRSPIPVLDDIGSGALVDMAQFGLSHEPMPQESVRAGAAVVAFSGDKLLGGPQAGILVGEREPIEACRRHPLARAFRADKYTLAALGATVLHYARGEAAREVPVLRMIATPGGEIARRAQALALAVSDWAAARGIGVQVIDGQSTVGGGSLPGETLPTKLVALSRDRPDALAAELRAAPAPVIARIQEGQVVLDPRTVLDDQALVDSIYSRHLPSMLTSTSTSTST